MTEMYFLRTFEVSAASLSLSLSLSFFVNELLQQEELAAPFCLCIRDP